MNINLQDGNQIHRLDHWHMHVLMEKDKDCCSSGQNDLKTWKKNKNFGGGLLDMILCPKIDEICRWLFGAQQISDEVLPAVFFILFEPEFLVNSDSRSSLRTVTLIFSHVFLAHIAPTNNNKKKSTWP